MTAEHEAHDVVVIGASAGGVEALISLVEALPADLPAAVFVVLHVASSATSVLGDILDRAGPLPAAQARDGDAVVPGRVLVAPPDRHLILSPAGVLLDPGPKENGHRPAVDPLFRSAAASFDGRVIGVVLSGTRDDGAAGLGVIKAAGGLAMAQEPAEALYPSMPRAAIEQVAVDAVAPCAELARIIAATVRAATEGGTTVPSHPDPPPPVSGGGGATGLTCPECGGALWERDEGNVARFACHVGHRYSAESLLEQHGETMEAALWTAVRILNERAAMLRRLADRTSRGPGSFGHRRFEQAAREAERHAAIVRDGIMSLAVPQDAEEEKTA
jgi:two-component system, chemotaxis family, protein-glutamate methylesterase/glutaminase